MRLTTRTKVFALALALSVGTVFGNSAHAETEATEGWQYLWTIYGWFPSIDGTLLYELPPADGDSIAVDAGDIIDKLDMAFMTAFEARHNKWSIIADLVYLRLADANNTDITVGPGGGTAVNADVNQELEGTIVTGAVGYNVFKTDAALLDVIGGVRYLSVDAEAELEVTGPLPPTPPPAKVSNSETLWDAIIGIKGQYMVSERWRVPYYADIGTGSANLTWQVLVGVGYDFKWGDVKLAYRHLAYDQGDDKFLQDISFSGPALGVGFRF